MTRIAVPRIEVRLYYNSEEICIGALALDEDSERFNYDGDHSNHEDVFIYPDQDIVGKRFVGIARDAVQIRYMPKTEQ